MAGVRPILAQLRVKIKCTIPNKYKTETYSIEIVGSGLQTV